MGKGEVLGKLREGRRRLRSFGVKRIGFSACS